MGFQTWGSAKADDATYGYDENITPEYLLIEGGENMDPAVNFRVPWHALQRTTGEGSTKQLSSAPTISYTQSLEEPWSNLLIDDESIIYEKRGALDVDYGVAELKDRTDKKYFEIAEECHNTLKFYREFYDFVYKQIQKKSNDVNKDISKLNKVDTNIKKITIIIINIFIIQVVDKVKLLLTTFLFGKKCDIMNVRVIIHSQQMHCQYSLFFINLL